MKKYYYLVSLPRSGNTVISSILNQNPKIAVSANSIVPSILWNVHETISNTTSFSNFPDEDSYVNVMKNIIPNYYQYWNQEYIIDRSNWGSPNNYKIIEKFSPNKPKYLILVRSIIEVLASFIKWSNENKPNFIDNESRASSIEDKCDFLMRPDLQIVQSYCAIYNIISQGNDDYLIIDYNNFVKNPELQIEKIYSFLGIEHFKHRFENLDNFYLNEVSYEDSVLGNNLHTINISRVEKSIYSIEDILTESVIKKYSNLDFWVKNN